MTENAMQSLKLPQKRYIQQHKENPEFTGYQEKIKGIIGGPIEIEFDWDSVAQALLTDHFESMYLNNGNNIKEWFMLNFENGLRMTCSDSMGQEAFRQKVKKVKFVHHVDCSLKLDNGTLIFAANLHGGGSPSKEAVNEFLNENL